MPRVFQGAGPGGGGGGSGTELVTNVTQVAHGFSVGDVIKSNGVDNQFALSQGNSPENSEAVGIVTDIINANNFTYVSSAIQLSGGFVPVGTPGQAVFLDPLVAGGMTITKPSTVGHVVRGLGTILASGATMYFDIAALAEEIVSSSGSGSAIVSEQNIGGFVDANPGSRLLQSTSSQDGSVFFIRAYAGAGQDESIWRYELDSNSGLYYQTHSDTYLTGNADDGIGGTMIVGDYVYAVGNTTNRVCFRFLAADLSGATAMSFSGGTATFTDPGGFTDGTFIYIHVGSGDFEQYSISGTTLTYVQTITGGEALVQVATYDENTDLVYMGTGGPDISAYTISGSTFALVASASYAIPQLFPTYTAYGGGLTGLSLSSNPNLLILAFNISLENDSGSGDTYAGCILKAFSKLI